MSTVPGFSLTMTISAGQLDVTIGAPLRFTNKTQGLIGVFNNDPNDDLLPANDTVPLSPSESERTIFYMFGETC